jgi:hypothetical protein
MSPPFPPSTLGELISMASVLYADHSKATPARNHPFLEYLQKRSQAHSCTPPKAARRVPIIAVDSLQGTLHLHHLPGHPEERGSPSTGGPSPPSFPLPLLPTRPHLPPGLQHRSPWLDRRPSTVLAAILLRLPLPKSSRVPQLCRGPESLAPVKGRPVEAHPFACTASVPTSSPLSRGLRPFGRNRVFPSPVSSWHLLITATSIITCMRCWIRWPRRSKVCPPFPSLPCLLSRTWRALTMLASCFAATSKAS